MRTFYLDRHSDVTGVSGPGVVAYGVEFDDGITVVHWLGEHRSTVVWPTLADAEAVHCHGGNTEIVFEDGTYAESLLQLHRLHDYIVDEVPGEPSEPAGAGDTAIRIMRAQREAIADLVQAIVHTVEYVGQETLKPYPGWSWFDALARHAPQVLAQIITRPVDTHALRELVDPDPQVLTESGAAERYAKVRELIRGE